MMKFEDIRAEIISCEGASYSLEISLRYWTIFALNLLSFSQIDLIAILGHQSMGC